MSVKHLENLCMINGASGDESRVRDYIKKNISHFADDITVDSMGSIIAFKKGTKYHNKKIIVSAHMDEVGFIISDITDDGFLKFKCVGGYDNRILLTQRLTITKSNGDETDGIIGIKAVHLQSADERKKVVSTDSMYIDIGASSKEDAMKYVSRGDYAVFSPNYKFLGGDCIKSKALDDRIGCAVMMNLMENEYESDIYFCFTTQEECGLRGARVIGQRLNADIAFVLEATTAADVPYVDKSMHCTTQGMGPAVSVMDRASYSNKELNKFVCKTADEAGIMYQFKKSAFGGNDAGGFQTAASGAKTCVISVPCRYIHSPVSTARQSDIDGMYNLANAVLNDINKFQI